MADPVVMPDIEAVAVAFLTARLNDPAVYVCDVLPPASQFGVLLPVVHVSRVAGTWKYRRVLDRPLLDVDVYGADFTATKTLAALVRGHLDDMAGAVYLGGVVTSCTEVTGPARRPEEDPNTYRIGFTRQIHLRPE